MSLEIKRDESPGRRLRLGMVGGGPGGFIGAVHRIAARLDDRFELVAAALSSDPARARAAALDLHIAPQRAYGSFAEMAASEAARKDRIDAVAIVTPNYLHYAPAKAFLEAGIHVICDKPLTTTLEDALDLARMVRRTDLLFAVTHNYTGYPLVRQAREMIAGGELGPLRVVQVEYAQDWLATPLERTGQKQAAWRTDPAQSGAAGSLGDIGTHAYNLAGFVTGLNCRELAAELSTFVPGRRLDDHVQIMLRFAEGARGLLWASQVATGNQNNLRLRVFREKGGLEWRQEDPNLLVWSPLGDAPRMIRRGTAAMNAAGQRVNRIPPGHPEGYLEAFATIYSEVAAAIIARRSGSAAAPALTYPTIEDGFAGAAMVDATLRSSRAGGVWVPIEF